MGGFTPNIMGSQNASLPPPPSFTSPSSGGFTPSAIPPGGASYTGQGTSTSFQDVPHHNDLQISPFLDPTLTNELLSFMGGNLGQGLPAFNQSVNLPSGGKTAPGSLSAPLNPVMQQLMDFMTGKSGPNALPGVMPMWQSEMSAMQQPIQANLANLQEQYGSMGALGSTESSTGVQDYLAQTSADEMSLLTSATMSALPAMATTGMDIQGIDQQAISNAYNQFQTDLPQNNPLMGDIMALGTMQPGTIKSQPTFLQGLVQSLMGNAGGLISGGVGALDSATGGSLPGWLTSLAGV